MAAEVRAMTPTAYKRARRELRQARADLRDWARRIRRTFDKGTFLSFEDAEGELSMLLEERRQVHAFSARLRAASVVPYSHLSPNAAERERRRRDA